ncbi:MAG TPA: hypothetical protein VFF79_18550 [Conexibacter sp.]|jgi:hypothetical protein|nr:hypothetical protein [Conexibacter sp.]
MRALRDVWDELVERRLWPVALLLVVALVAVPVALTKQPPPDGAAAGTDAPPATAAAADLRSSGGPVVSLAQGAGPDAPLRGRAKDPFHQQFVPPRAASAGGTAPTRGATSGGATSGGGQGGGANRGSGRGGAPKPQRKTYVYASVNVRFGRAGSPLREIDDVPRLTPLPSAASPVVIFIGMRADHETAVFMVSTDVHAQGDGRCAPSTKVCEAIELRRGGIALLDLRAADGSVTQYELDLLDVALHQTTSKATAQASRVGAHDAWLQRDGAGAVGSTVRAVTGAVPRAPVLTPLP